MYPKLQPWLAISWLWNRSKGSNCSNTPFACFMVESEGLPQFMLLLLAALWEVDDWFVYTIVDALSSWSDKIVNGHCHRSDKGKSLSAGLKSECYWQCPSQALQPRWKLVQCSWLPIRELLTRVPMDYSTFSASVLSTSTTELKAIDKRYQHSCLSRAIGSCAVAVDIGCKS